MNRLIRRTPQLGMATPGRASSLTPYSTETLEKRVPDQQCWSSAIQSAQEVDPFSDNSTRKMLQWLRGDHGENKKRLRCMNRWQIIRYIYIFRPTKTTGIPTRLTSEQQASHNMHGHKLREWQGTTPFRSECGTYGLRL